MPLSRCELCGRIFSVKERNEQTVQYVDEGGARSRLVIACDLCLLRMDLGIKRLQGDENEFVITLNDFADYELAFGEKNVSVRTG